jgi:hypothetical protein
MYAARGREGAQTSAISLFFAVNASRTARAAWTMFVNAASVSGHARVFKPQSKLTHRCSAGMTLHARSSRLCIVSTLGTRAACES